MSHRKQWTAAVLIIAAVTLAGCSGDPAATNKRAQAAQVSSLDSTGTRRLTLTREAADRLVVRTVPVQESTVPPRVPGGPGVARKVVPYAALLYDANGGTWVYTAPQPLTYVRQRITVDYIVGDLVVLSDGPPAGTAVVTTGAAELYGAELNAGQ